MSFYTVSIILSLVGTVLVVWLFNRSRKEILAQRIAQEQLRFWIHKSDVHRKENMQALTVTSIGTATTTSSKSGESNRIFVSYSHPDVDHVSGVFLRAAEWAYRVEAQGLQTRPRTEKLLQAWSALLPARINNEVLGDYLEDIHQRIAAGQSRWIISLRIVAAVFWTATDTIGYLLKAIGRSKSTN